MRKNNEFTDILEKYDLWSINFVSVEILRICKNIKMFDEMIKMSIKVKKYNEFIEILDKSDLWSKNIVFVEK